MLEYIFYSSSRGIDINRERWEEQRPWMGALEEVKSRDKVIHQEAYP